MITNSNFWSESLVRFYRSHEAPHTLFTVAIDGHFFTLFFRLSAFFFYFVQFCSTPEMRLLASCTWRFQICSLGFRVSPNENFSSMSDGLSTKIFMDKSISILFLCDVEYEFFVQNKEDFFSSLTCSTIFLKSPNYKDLANTYFRSCCRSQRYPGLHK